MRDLLQAAPGTRPYLDSINNRILTGDLYKALKEARKLIAHEKRNRSTMHYASNAYAKTAIETASPRELEASLLLQAAAKLQAVHDSWSDKPPGLNDALLYNRRLWTIFLDAVMSEKNRLPIAVRENLRRLGVYIMAETFSPDDQTAAGPPGVDHQDQSWHCRRPARKGVKSCRLRDLRGLRISESRRRLFVHKSESLDH